MRNESDMKKYIETIKKTNLFYKINSCDIEKMLTCLEARVEDFEKGEMILWEGDQVEQISIILSGSARTIKDSILGKTTTVTRLMQGDFIGILLAASHRRDSPVSVETLEKTKVLHLPIKKMIDRCPKACVSHNHVLHNYWDCIVEKALILHDRNDCLIKPSIRDKVLTYLSMEAKCKGDYFEIIMNRQELSEYLNVDRSALSRELSKMKRDGIIDYHKNRFRLLF